MTIRSPPDKPASMSSTALEEMDLFPGSDGQPDSQGTVIQMRILGSLAFWPWIGVAAALLCGHVNTKRHRTM